MAPDPKFDPKSNPKSDPRSNPKSDPPSTLRHDRTGEAARALVALMAQLRDREHGCPWDVEQTFATIAPYTIEEAYEVADAIERNDMPAKEELGDLLFQVAFHARMAEEQAHLILPTSRKRSPTR